MRDSKGSTKLVNGSTKLVKSSKRLVKGSTKLVKGFWPKTVKIVFSLCPYV